MFGTRAIGKRLAFGVGALVLGDLVIGLTASSTIMLGSLWLCSVGWLEARVASAGLGVVFGSDLQLALACLGAAAALPAAGVTLYLAREAARLPLRWIRHSTR